MRESCRCLLRAPPKPTVAVPQRCPSAAADPQIRCTAFTHPAHLELRSEALGTCQHICFCGANAA